MSSPDAVDKVFAEADTNRDGRIDKSELRNLISKNEGVTSPTPEMSTVGDDLNNNTNRYERYRYKGSPAIASDLSNEVPIKSTGPDETSRYLQKLGNSVFVDSNPQILRKPPIERPVTYEQRIMLRCLQPPPLPPPEPLIVKEVRSEQPPLPPPLVIREHGACSTQPPPLILRERPPVPPPRTPSETIVRHLPPVPLPPRSLVVERFPDCPEKPRDIIIERWLPYPPESERRKIVQPAPPPMRYPAPTHTVIIYDAVQPNIVRKFERLGVSQEDPETYMSRFGASLLDRDSLLQRARQAGVVEDITCSSTNSSGVLGVPTPRGNFVDIEKSNDFVTHGSSSSGGANYGATQRISSTEVTNVTSRRFSSSSSHGYIHSTGNGGGRETRSTYRADEPDITITATIRRDSEITEREKHRYF